MSLLGIEYGNKKIGLAKSAGAMAVPFGILENRGVDDAIDTLKKLCTTEKIEKIIVGVPKNLAGGKSGQQLETVRKFIKKLSALGLPIIEEDERMSTKLAKGLQKGMQYSGADDASAAAVILQSYLDKTV